MAGKKISTRGEKDVQVSEISAIHKKLDRLLDLEEKRNAEINEMKSLIRQLTESLKKNSETINNLRTELEETQQYQRINNLIIDGIPELEREDTSELVIKMGKAIGLDIDRRDIDISHRLPKNKKQHSPIIVKFTRRTVKTDILKNRRNLVNVSSNQIVKGSSNNKIYVNEHLTKRNQALFSSARKLKEEGLIIDVWIRDCKIFYKLNQDSAMRRISNAEDLEDIKLGPEWKRSTRRKYLPVNA